MATKNRPGNAKFSDRKLFVMLATLFLLMTMLVSCNSQKSISQNSSDATSVANESAVAKVLDNWHHYAATTNFKSYFDLMTPEAVFIGTDATENWSKSEFENYARAPFVKGKAWNFTSVQRTISFSKDQQTAWFDELLDTQMKICRGSGVLQKENGQWKIAQYVLSMTIPNEHSTEVIKIKTPQEEALLSEIKSKK